MRNLVLYSMLQTGLSRKRIFFAFQTYTYDKLTHPYKHPFNCTIIFRSFRTELRFHTYLIP